MRRLQLYSATILLVALTGCITTNRPDGQIYRPDNSPHTGAAVEVFVSPLQWGTGAVIDTNRVLTTAHVVDGVMPVWVAGQPATVEERIPGAREDLVVLRVEDNTFKEIEIFKVDSRYAVPAYVWTLDGRQPFHPSTVVNGHSGSPILNSKGFLIGVVFGRGTEGPPPDFDWDDYRYDVYPGQVTVPSIVPNNWHPR